MLEHAGHVGCCNAGYSELRIRKYTLGRYNSNIIYCYVNGVLWTIIAIGFGGFQANVIQFGINQLYDASIDEILRL